MKTTTYAIAMTVLALGIGILALDQQYQDYAAERKCSLDLNVNACRKVYVPVRPHEVQVVREEARLLLPPEMN